VRYHANNTKYKSYLMSFTIRLLIWFKSRLVGQDSFGNRYYEERADKVPAGNRQRRWVVYKGHHEASKVPPEWHACLHYRAEQPLHGEVYAWQKPHQPNFTGTPLAHTQEKREAKILKLTPKAKRSYEPWNPNG